MKLATLVLAATLLATVAHAGSKVPPCPPCPEIVPPRIFLADGDSLDLLGGNYMLRRHAPKVVTRWRTRTVRETVLVADRYRGVVAPETERQYAPQWRGAGARVDQLPSRGLRDNSPAAPSACPPFHAPEIRCERTPWYAIAGVALGGVALGALLHHDSDVRVIATASASVTPAPLPPCQPPRHRKCR